MHTIYLAIGANVGDKKANIQKAVRMLSEKIDKLVLAPLYETTPWGFANQENFLNTVCAGHTDLNPEDLLQFVKSVEEKVGRVKRFINGPREIDIDMLLYDDLVYRSETLTVPHPRMHERDFVLQPLSDLAPHLFHPVLQKPVSTLLAEIPQAERFVIKKA